MAQRQLLQSDYARAVVRSKARHVIPQNALWKSVDYIPDILEEPLAKRGGWSRGSVALAGETEVKAVGYAAFDAGPQRIAIGDSGSLWKIDADLTSTKIGACVIPKQAPIFFNNALIFPSPDGTTLPQQYDGIGTPADLAGTPFTGQYGLVYKSRLALLGSADRPETIAWSDPLDQNTWDSGATMDTDHPIVGGGALKNAILVFSEGRTEWIRGTTPPPDTDMERETKFEMGCLDARSIAPYGDTIIWANSLGVWQTDGAALDNMIQIGGLQPYWDDLMREYVAGQWTLAAQVMHGLYILSITDGSNFIDCLVCDINRRAWWMFSNFNFSMFALAEGVSEEVYAAINGTNYIAKLSTIFTPGPDVRVDGDGTNVEPVIETSFYRGAPGKKRWKKLALTNHLVDQFGNARLEVDIIKHSDDTTYETVTDDAGVVRQILPSDDAVTSALPLHTVADGLGFRIRQVGASDTTAIFDIAAEVRPLEPSR